MASPRIALVIPAYNEEKCLPRLLASVGAARARYRGGTDAVEVVVADNASTDSTAQVARVRGCKVAPVMKRVIAASRNGGARASSAEILAFVDADSLIHPETFNAIEASLADARVIGGATGVIMERWSLGIGLVYLLMLPIVKLGGVDTGVVFCRRADFEAVGGYNEERLIAEDVQFLLDLKRLGRSRGQRFERIRGAKAVASTRKFDRHGDWHYLTGMFGVAWAFLFSRRRLHRWIRTYWYEDR
ncbi:MAG TPA: glycosyltransferase [Candidatus Polarisedimenticolia bacterium]|jgi:glycosyltransferase involved in cell wall biosynthesis|nr:glycosyltransferase [Candidatus Polarisedimenticolia bacterium]